MKSPPISSFIIVGIIAIILATIVSSSGTTILPEQRPEVVCDIGIEANFFTPSIESPTQCLRTGNTCRDYTTLSFFTERGILVFDTDDTTESQKFQVQRLSPQTITQRICTNADIVQVRMIDDSGFQVDSTQVRVQ